MGSPPAAPGSAQEAVEAMSRMAEGWGIHFQQWQRRIAEQFAEAFAQNAGPVREKPVTQVGSTTTIIKPDFEGFDKAVKSAPEPHLVELITVEDIKRHIAKMFVEGDIEVEEDYLGTYAFPSKRHVYLAVEDLNADAGTTPARVFEVEVREIV